MSSIEVEPPAEVVCPPVRADLQLAIKQLLGDEDQDPESQQVRALNPGSEARSVGTLWSRVQSRRAVVSAIGEIAR